MVKEISDEVTKVSKTSPQNNLETVTNKGENIALDGETPWERYIFPGKRQNIHS